MLDAELKFIEMLREAGRSIEKYSTSTDGGSFFAILPTVLFSPMA